MGSIIHMDTEQVRAVARQLQQTANQIYEMGSSLRNQTASMDWQGPSRDDFFSQLEETIKQLTALAESGLTLGERVNREVDEWATADQNGAATWTSLLNDFKEFAPSLPTDWSNPGGVILLGGGAVLGIQTGASEVAAYQDSRGNNTLLIDPHDDTDYQEALRSTKQGLFESDEHFEWRVEREAERLRWKREYYSEEENRWKSDYQPDANWLTKFIKKLREGSEWKKHREEWEQNNPEPKYLGGNE